MRKTSKRIAATMLCALLLTACAAAEGSPDIVGRVSEDRLIYRHTADNGQAIYFVAGPTEPWVRDEDVNFDGVGDVVVTTITGASNFYCEFFVWHGNEYVFADHGGAEYGLCNYELYPEKRLVLSAQNNGYAGALFAWHLFRWEGAALKLVRSAVSTEYSTTEYKDSMITTVTDTQKIRVVIYDYAQNVYEGETLYDQVLSLDDVTAESFVEWNGILLSGL